MILLSFFDPQFLGKKKTNYWNKYRYIPKERSLFFRDTNFFIKNAYSF